MEREIEIRKGNTYLVTRVQQNLNVMNPQIQSECVIMTVTDNSYKYVLITGGQAGGIYGGGGGGISVQWTSKEDFAAMYNIIEEIY